ncbi:MAG TPA: histidine phosphatase family protein [Methylococcus sp.]|nr:histidine phosphatase family protein [Methylococcus sp.]
MKQLFLIRHAKSSWNDPMADRDRPLTGRGKRDASFMGSLLRFRGFEPDRILSSPARRARKTARRIAREVGYPKDAIEVRDELYLSGPGAVIAVIQALEEGANRVYLVGHNPDLSQVASRLTGEDQGEMPTCGIVAIEFPVERWAYVMEGSGRVLFVDDPKRYFVPGG